MIIGLEGKARSGKGTVASFLVEQGFEEIQFSTRLKEAAYELNPMVDVAFSGPWARLRDQGTIVRLADLVDLLGWEEAKANPEVRRTLQRMGTEVMRDLFNDDIHALFAMQEIDDSRTGGQEDFVISDLRFDNEAEIIKAVGGLIIRVVRPGIEEALSLENQEHASEAGVEDNLVDITIVNDGTVEELKNNVSDILQMVRGKKKAALRD